MAGTNTHYTVKEARTILAQHGLTIRSSDGEYRVAFKNDPKAEDSAYYTTTLVDAIGTGIAMAEHRAKAAAPKTYRLGSNDFVNAAGVIRWAINGASFERDRPKMVNVVSQTWGVPEAAALALLTRQVPFTVENGAVVFTA